MGGATRSFALRDRIAARGRQFPVALALDQDEFFQGIAADGTAFKGSDKAGQMRYLATPVLGNN